MFRHTTGPNPLGFGTRNGFTVGPMTCPPSKGGTEVHITPPFPCPATQRAFLGGGGSNLGRLATPSYQTALERALGIRNQSSPVL